MTTTPDPRSAKETDEYGPLPVNQATCDHHWVQTWSGNRAGRLWACGDCKLRFYPACRTCVEVGHRNVDHPPATLSEPKP